MLNEWPVAYSAIAEVAATLSGLLFVSLSVKLAGATRDERNWMLFVARRSFFDFLAVLGLALLYLMPNVLISEVNWFQLFLCLARVTWHVRHWRSFGATAGWIAHVKEQLVPFIATGLMSLAVIGVWLSWPVAPNLTYIGAIILLFGACQNAWRLLVR